MIFFDAVYYLCCHFYKKREKDTFKGSGIILMTVALLLNFLLIIYFDSIVELRSLEPDEDMLTTTIFF